MSRRTAVRVLSAAVVALAGGTGVVLAATHGDGGGPPPPASDASRDRWLGLRDATLARTEVAAARIGRFVYVVGGFEQRSGQTTPAVERYDIRHDRWKRVRPMPVGLNHATAAAYRGRVYVHGGYTARRDLSSATARLFVYDPRRDRWRRLPRSRTPRAAHALGVVGNGLYAAGGKNDRGELRSLEMYDFKRRRWRRGPRMKGPVRDHMAGVAAGGYLYALAGRDLSRGGSGNFRVAERYSPRRRRWERLPGMRKARGGIAAVRLSRGRVAVLGGEEGRGTIASVELFDPATRRWRPLPPMRTPRHGLGGVASGNRVYAIEGGPQPGFHFSSGIEFLDVR